MRHTKFRAWSGKSGKYLEYPFSVLADGTGIRVTVPVEDSDVESVNAEFYFRDNEDLVVQQYTGLIDKNGVEIYEGDVVRLDPRPDGTNAVDAAVIEYMPEAMWYAAKVGDDFGPFGGQNLLDDSKGYGWRAWLRENDYMCHMVEIVGNIHENPELLEAKA